MMRNAILFLACAAASPLAHVAAAEKPAQQATSFQADLPVSFKYLLYLPSDYESKGPWPLVIFLHGAGERGDDLNLVKKHGPPKQIEEGKSLPFIVVSPQCAKDSSWSTQERELKALIDEIVKKYKVDPDRVYLTGLSMGGFGTWALAAYDPDRFAAIIPICGGGEPISARRLVHIPVWAFHGAKDQVVPLKRSEEMVEALEKAKGNVKLTVYPEAGHDSWTATYDNPEVYQWLLAQKRAPKP
jgi:predicted peptidase